jgi:stage II sporulation protein D
MVIIRADGSPTARKAGPLLVRATTPGSYVTYEGKRYRGELVVTVNEGALLVVNRLGVESYLRGVVPLEIGDRKPGEEAVVEAQAVAARSYTYVHMSEAGNRGFDMYGSIQDQAYGGVDAEKPMSDAAVASTRDMVIKYAGKIINTPYLHVRRANGYGPRSVVEAAGSAVSAASERSDSGDEFVLLRSLSAVQMDCDVRSGTASQLAREIPCHRDTRG